MFEFGRALDLQREMERYLQQVGRQGYVQMIRDDIAMARVIEDTEVELANMLNA